MNEEHNKIELRSTILDSLEALEIVDDRTRDLVKMSNSTYGLLSSVPMLCRDTCMYKEICPLAKEDIAPVGDRCPIEVDLIKSMFVAYCRDMAINPDTDKVEAALVKDLCVIEVQAFRATKLMGFKDFIEQSVTAVNPNNGEVYYKDDLHISVLWNEKLLNQKIRVLDALVATPYARLKATGRLDKSSVASKLSGYKAQTLNIMPREEYINEEYDIGSYQDDGD